MEDEYKLKRGPYSVSAAPPEPPPPPRFSPLRPIQAFGKWLGGMLWWYLTLSTKSWIDTQARDSHGQMYASGEPTGFGCLGGLVAITSVAMTAGSFFGALRHASWWVIFWGTSALLRLWLRAAMHLDEPESYDWWKEKLT